MSTVTYQATQSLSAAKAAAVAPNEPLWLGVRVSMWTRVATLAVLFVLLFWPNLRRLWEKTNPISGDDNWKHGIFVPLIGLYYLYVNRDLLMRAKIKTAWSGLGITIGGLLFFTYGIYPGQNDWFKDIGMVTTLFGLVSLIWGWDVMKVAWFPIVFLISALPWPGLFYSLLAGPLQKLAANVAVRMLTFFGVPSGQFGTKIFIEGANHVVRTLNVAEACAGLRSLMSFIAIAGAVAFLSYRPLWQKIIMVLSAIPIAIFCNTMRITVQGLFDGYLSHQWSESFAHGFLGLAMMIPAFFMILLVGWVLQNILIEEVQKKTIRAPMTTGPRSAGNAGPTRVAAVSNRRVEPVAGLVEIPVRPTAAIPASRPATQRRAASMPAVASSADETPALTALAAIKLPAAPTKASAGAPASAAPAATPRPVGGGLTGSPAAPVARKTVNAPLPAPNGAGGVQPAGARVTRPASASAAAAASAPAVKAAPASGAAVAPAARSAPSAVAPADASRTRPPTRATGPVAAPAVVSPSPAKPSTTQETP